LQVSSFTGSVRKVAAGAPHPYAFICTVLTSRASETNEIYRAFPRGQLLILPATGHATFEERPDILNVAIRFFLEAPDAVAKPQYIVGHCRELTRLRCHWTSTKLGSERRPTA
jgi:hypothetical protein